MINMTRCVIVALMSLIAVSVGNADNIMVTNVLSNPPGILAYGNTKYHMTIGHDFLVGSKPYTIRYLGYYDHNQDGLTLPFEVYIWTWEGTLLTSVIVPAGTNAPLYAGCRWVRLNDSVTLQPETPYIITSINKSNNYDIYDARYGMSTSVAQGTPDLSFYHGIWVYAIALGASAASPGTCITMTNFSLGPNLASSIDPFEPERGTLNVAWIPDDTTPSLTITNPSPFYTYALQCSTSLVNAVWHPVESFTGLMTASGACWRVSNDVGCCYFRYTATPR